jgi:hypothetical protein
MIFTRQFAAITRAADGSTAIEPRLPGNSSHASGDAPHSQMGGRMHHRTTIHHADLIENTINSLAVSNRAAKSHLAVLAVAPSKTAERGKRSAVVNSSIVGKDV